MGVYIKDMEMPKDCIVCPFGWNGCNNQHDFVYMGSRPDDCPLISVPEPHGRLIDEEKLKETLDYYIREAGWSDEINKALNWVKDEFINSEPTIIPASEEG